jgi:isoquinoline 1-oxidoreductase
MNMTRRQFFASLGGAGLIYAIRFSPPANAQTVPGETIAELEESVCRPVFTDTDYREWIIFSPDDTVGVFTNRTELGQGLRTVITAVITQGLDIEAGQLTIVQGDTDCCPDDGPTLGSGATQMVGWGFWQACQKIRANLLARASRFLGIPLAELEYRSGGVGLKGKSGKLVSAYELGRGRTVVITIDPKASPMAAQYVDRGIGNVNGEKIVTGELKYAGDLHMPGMLYAGWKVQPYHDRITKLLSADMKAARGLPGVKMVEVVQGRAAAAGERYTDVQKALDLVKTEWSVPKRSRQLPLEEARIGAELEELKEQTGDVEAGLAASDLVISETYTTQYITHAPMETETAVAAVDKAAGRVTVWVSSQYPFLARKLVAEHLNMSEAGVHVIAMPAGGAFGGKIGNAVNREAAKFADIADTPIKLIYSRKDQFQLYSLYKAACIIDVTTGVDAAGMMVARKVDIYQDIGDGTTHTYTIPNALARAYRADWPFGRASTRGTSFVQTCFATESHVDMVAHRLGMDPLDFRRQNVCYPAYVNLIDKCAEMIDYGTASLGADEGIGLAIINHGGAQLGAIAARVFVDRVTGKIKVKHVCVAFDIGIVISRGTAIPCIQGGVAWGIGYALGEEIKLDGHQTYTEYLSEYRVPRFSDMPPVIDIEFLDNHQPYGTVRGCGEMPVIPTIGAIANAVYNATGIRFYSTPITPEKVKNAVYASGGPSGSRFL